MRNIFLIRRFRRDTRGSVVTETALLLPLLILLSLGTLDVTLMFHKYISLGEAVRQAAREAAIESTVADLSVLEDGGDSITCGYDDDDDVDCGSYSVSSSSSFAAVLSAVQGVLPDVEGSNLSIQYRLAEDSGGDASAGNKAMVTVRIDNYSYTWQALTFIGLTTLDFPTISATRLRSL